MIVEISKLKINPIYSEIYQTNDIEALAESIKENGLLQKIVVNENFVIISGVRRFLALKQLNVKEVEVEIKKLDEVDELITLIEFNRQRVKTSREQLNEIKYLKELWGKRRGRKTKEESLENKEGSIKVDTRKQISETIGISAGNISKLQYIEKMKPELIDAIDKGNVSINQAHTVVVKIENDKKTKQFKASAPKTITNDFFTLYNKSCYDLSDLEDKSIQTIFTSPPYWNKRTYSTSPDELGLEKTSKEFVRIMADHLHQCHRVLKDSGSLFLNLGDLDKELKDLELSEIKKIIEKLNELQKQLSEKERRMEDKPKEPPKLLTVKEAAAYLGVTTQTIHNLKNSGKIKFRKIGGSIRFTYEDLNIYFFQTSVRLAECKRSTIWIDKISREVLPFEEGKYYKIFKENRIWIYLFQEQWGEQARFGKKEFRKNFNRAPEWQNEAIGKYTF